MKVYRVTVAIDPEGNVLEAGALFSTGVASGRIPLKLSPKLVARVIAEAQSQLDAQTAKLSEVPPKEVTRALHQLRSVKQDHEILVSQLEAKRTLLEEKRTQLEAAKADLAKTRSPKAKAKTRRSR